MGVVFILVPLPLTLAWSLPLLAGGGIMCVASLFMAEGAGPVRPPEGFRFCVFCSTLVPDGSARCPQCNGLQPPEGA